MLQAAQTQNNIAKTQNTIAQTQNSISDKVKRMQDNLSNRIGNVGRNVVEYSSPGANRKVTISDDGVTEEVVANYISLDGNRRGYAVSRTTVANNRT